MQTPYFLIHENLLNENVMAFQQALSKCWPNSQLSYSVKTNSLPWLLEHLREMNVFAEVVSDEEYQLALLCGYTDNRIVFNGPIKGNEMIKRSLQNGTVVNMDSENDLRVWEENRSNDAVVGIRVNVSPEVFNVNDIGYAEDGFRFGFSEENGALERALHRIGRVDVGLHLHCNSITRAKEVYIAIAKYATGIIKKYKLIPAYIDMGGGFFGGVPGKTTPEEYIQAIGKEFESVVDFEKTKLIIEPGSAIIGSVVDLYTSVLDAKDTNHARIVTTDGSRIHIDPLWIKHGYMHTIYAKSSEKHPKQVICGYTCMDHDRLMIIEDEKELSVGDQIVYHKVGAYSMTFGGMFIRYLPNVYVEKMNSIKQVRGSITTKRYLDIQRGVGEYGEC